MSVRKFVMKHFGSTKLRSVNFFLKKRYLERKLNLEALHKGLRAQHDFRNIP